jgi:hypothetical protein
MIVTLTTILTLFLPSHLGAADTLRAGAPPAAAREMRPGVDTVDVYATRNGERKLFMRYVESVTATPEGFLIVERNERVPSGMLASLDSISLARGTLATLWHGEVSPAGHRHVTFAAGRVTGTLVDSAGRSTTIDSLAPGDLFDYSIFTKAVDRMSLAPGYRAVVAAYDIGRGPVFVPIEVVGQEDVTIDGKTVKTLKMELDFGRWKTERWIAADTHREVRWHLAVGGNEMSGERHAAR